MTGASDVDPVVRRVVKRLWPLAAVAIVLTIGAQAILKGQPSGLWFAVALVARIGSVSGFLIRAVQIIAAEDELMRRIVFESLGQAFIVTTILFSTFGMLEGSKHIAHVPWVWVPVLMLSLWVVSWCLTLRRYRVE